MSRSRAYNIVALSFGKGLATVVTLVTGMVMARLLTRGELATYRQTMLAYQVALPLLSLGVGAGIFYFLPTETCRPRGVVVDGMLIMVGMGCVYALFIALGGNHLLARRFSNPAIAETLIFLVPLPLIALPASLISAVLVVRNHVKRLSFYHVASNVMTGLGLVAACFFWRTPEAMVVANVSVGMVVGLVAIRLIFSALPAGSWRPRVGTMKNIVALGFPLAASHLLGTLSQQLDKIVVSVMCTPEEFAIYSMGALEIPLIGIVTGSIATIILPDLRRLVAAGDNRSALGLFHMSAKQSAVVLLPVMLFLMVSAEPFILTMFSSKYAGSVLPFRLYLLVLPIRIVFYSAILTAFGKSKLVLVRTLASLAINLVLSVLFVRLLGFIGAIVATLATIYLWGTVFNIEAIARLLAIRRTQVLPFADLGKIFLASLIALPLTGLSIHLWHVSPPWRLLLNASLYFPPTAFALMGLGFLPSGFKRKRVANGND